MRSCNTADSKGVVGAAATSYRYRCTEIAGDPTERHKWLVSDNLHVLLPGTLTKMTHVWVNCRRAADSKGVVGAAATSYRYRCTEIAGDPILAERRGACAVALKSPLLCARKP
jgi:hypothetical protein